MRNLLNAFLAALLSFQAPLHAESRDEILLRESMEVAAKIGAQEVARGYLDDAVTNVPGVGEVSNFGGSVVFAVNMGLAINDFANAETDKGRGMATASGAVSVVYLVNPAAGLVCSAVLLAVQLLDGHLSAEHAKEMMEIYARIARHYKEVARIHGKMVMSEQVLFLESFKRVSAADLLVKEGLEYLKQNCSEEIKLDTLEKVDGCLKSLIQAFAQSRVLVDETAWVLSVPTSYFKIEDLLATNNITRTDIEQRLQTYREDFRLREESLNETLRIYGEWTAAILIAKAREEEFYPGTIVFKRKCLLTAQDLSASALLFNVGIRPNLASDIYQLDDQMEMFLYSNCLDVNSPDPILNEMYERSHQNFVNALTLFRVQHESLLSGDQS